MALPRELEAMLHAPFDPTAAGYEAQALAVERAAQAAMGGSAVHIGGADSA